jgi:hypothetical protein
MISEIANFRLRCLSCKREWTPQIEGQLPLQCTACRVCSRCESVNSTGKRHQCQQQHITA